MNTPSDSIATRPLPAKVATLWTVASVLTGVVVGLPVVVIGVIAGESVVALAGVVAFVLVAGLGWAGSRLHHKAWRWGLDDRWIEARHGVVVRQEQIVPRSRVQTLTTRTGPLDRLLDLTSVIVHTAGTHSPNLTIPHLDTADVERLKAELGG